MKKTSFSEMHCSLARSLDRIGDWWTPLLLRDLFLGVGRFDDIVEDLGISRNLLATRLKGLVEGGLVERVAYQEHPARYEYKLTDAGYALVPALLALTAWGDRWVAGPEGPPLRFRHDRCGEIFEPTVVCSCCGEPVDVRQVSALPGPGGAVGPGTRVVARRVAAAARRKDRG